MTPCMVAMEAAIIRQMVLPGTVLVAQPKKATVASDASLVFRPQTSQSPGRPRALSNLSATTSDRLRTMRLTRSGPAAPLTRDACPAP